LETLLDIPITGPKQPRPIPLRNVVKLPLQKVEVPSEVVHTNLQPTMDLTMGVHGRDLGHVAAEVERVVAKYGQPRTKEVKFAGLKFRVDDGSWTPFDPDSSDPKPMEGSRVVMSGEYQKMRDT